MGLQIGLLGPLVIENDQRRIGKLPRKARALMAYLAVQGGRAISRERLSDLLWPYQGSEQARHSLRNCLLELRKALGEAAKRHLVAEFANCRLQEIDTDINRFEHLSRAHNRSDLFAAAELYRGEFLADFVIDSEPFQEWLAGERDRTLDLICGVLQRLTELQDEAGEHEAAIRSARRLASLDPLSEIGQRALIRAYARAGRRPEALRQYRTCAEILKRELGVAPDAETQALANEIARTGGILGPAAARPLAHLGDDRLAAADTPPVRRGIALANSIPEIARLRWPCLLPPIAVGVTPLRNLTGDDRQQYVVDAFTDDLVTDLARHGRGLALARVAEEGRRTGDLPPRIANSEIEYVVTGSAQRSGPGNLRVNMQITNAVTAEYCWADRYEFEVETLGSTQANIARQVSRELHLLVLQQASRRAVMTSGDEFSVSDCLSRAMTALNKGRITPEVTAEAQRWLLRALAQDRRNVQALSGLAATCQHLVTNPWWDDPHAVAALSDLGRDAVEIALDLAPGHALAKCIQGMLHSAAGRLEEAEQAIEQALALDPGLGLAHGFAGYNAALLGRAHETLPAAERAMRLDRTDRRQSIFLFYGGFAELLLGRSEASFALLRKSLELSPTYGTAQLFMMAALLMLGRKAEAARAATAFREQYPQARTNDLEQLWLARSTNPIYRTQVDPIFDKIRSLGIGS
jgi:DNA-binding SARP family transcriptional activator/TolB-like protein